MAVSDFESRHRTILQPEAILPDGAFARSGGSSPMALGEQERQLIQLIDMVRCLSGASRQKGEPSYFNKRLVEWLGLDVQDLDTPGISRLAATIQTVVHPDDAVSLQEGLNRSFTTGGSFSLKYRLRRFHGVYRWIEGRAEPMRNSDGRILRWYGLCFDIEDQIRAETALRQSEHRLRQVMDAVPALIWSATPDGAASYVESVIRLHGPLAGGSRPARRTAKEGTYERTNPSR